MTTWRSTGRPPLVCWERAVHGAEIVRGEARPSTQTDLFSLSVLLFYMFIVNHPLEGAREAAIRCLDLPAMNKLYGTEPVFIFDPDDTSNRPLKDYHDNALIYWPIYPQFLRELFTKAFTEGIRDPQNGRIRESEWRAAMVHLSDSILYCSQCSLENFYDGDALKASGGTPAPCWNCKSAIRLPPRMRHQQDRSHAQLRYPALSTSYRCGQTVRLFSADCRGIPHPTNPGVWGLKNLSSEKWVCTLADGSVKDVEPDRSVTLAAGVRIQFGKSEGEIRAKGETRTGHRINWNHAAGGQTTSRLRNDGSIWVQRCRPFLSVR